MGGAYGTNGREDRRAQGMKRNVKENTCLEDPGVNERIILKCILKKLVGVA
jgi:hypothetical protein